MSRDLSVPRFWKGGAGNLAYNSPRVGLISAGGYHRTSFHVQSAGLGHGWAIGDEKMKVGEREKGEKGEKGGE